MFKSTIDYNIFKISPKNRPIDQSNLAHIVESIKAHNLLEYRPILVDSQMNVIDGQHRLRAAEKLGLPIYYSIEPTLKTDDIWLLNANQKAWSHEDFYNFHINSGKPEYLKLKKFREKYNLKLRVALAVLGWTRSIEEYREFNQGDFIFPNDVTYKKIEDRLSNIDRVIEFISEKTPHRGIRNSTFVRAITYFMDIENVDFDTFMHKLEYQLKFFRKCSTISDYLGVFETIYNWKNTRPVSVDGLV